MANYDYRSTRPETSISKFVKTNLHSKTLEWKPEGNWNQSEQHYLKENQTNSVFSNYFMEPVASDFLKTHTIYSQLIYIIQKENDPIAWGKIQVFSQSFRLGHMFLYIPETSSSKREAFGFLLSIAFSLLGCDRVRFNRDDTNDALLSEKLAVTATTFSKTSYGTFKNEKLKLYEIRRGDWTRKATHKENLRSLLHLL